LPARFAKRPGNGRIFAEKGKKMSLNIKNEEAHRARPRVGSADRREHDGRCHRGARERIERVQAYRDYGRGSGHPARLNFGDCFAYALARSIGEPLLFKGEDFRHTDIAPALA
jgi:uncharacterized protein with PIN domain